MYRSRTQRITFEDAKLYISENTLEQLGRSQAQEEHYKEWKHQMQQEWWDITDFILHDKFAVVGEEVNIHV